MTNAQASKQDSPVIIRRSRLVCSENFGLNQNDTTIYANTMPTKIIKRGVILMYAKDVKLLTLRNSFISVMIKWLPFVLYLNSSVILSAIYNTLCKSMASHPFRNSSNAPRKINPAIKMLNNMIVGWSAMKMTSLLRYLSWFSSAMQTMKIGNSNSNIRLVMVNRSVFSFRRSLQAQIFARNAEIILCSDSITEPFPFQ